MSRLLFLPALVLLFHTCRPSSPWSVVRVQTLCFPHGDPGFSVGAFVVHITRGTLMSLVSASVLETLSVVCFVMCVEDVVGCVFASLWPDCPCNTRVHVHDSFLCAVELPVSHSLVGFHLSDGRCIPCAGAASRCENARPLHP
jgi:hypothetical protein